MRSATIRRLLVVEDDRPIADLLKHHFAGAGFTVTTTPNGDEALILIEEIKPDLVILDWMIEGTSGVEVCRQVRRSRSTTRLPIIMLTARGEEDDRVRGLETGADDFVPKPFSPKELLARANALLRRSAPNLMAEKLTYGGIDLDTAAHRVRRDGRSVSLGPTEYRLLHHFLRNPERVYSRQQLLDIIWPHNEEVELRTVDVLIRRLRVALGPGDDVIRTVRSEGYALDRSVS